MRTSPSRQASTDAGVVEMLILHLRKMLVTFIAMACVSCSFIPKKEINGTAQERPKLAQDVLTSLNTVNATLEVLYNSVSRGLGVTGQNALDFFIVEAAAKKKEPQLQADLIKVAFEILIDLRAAKLETSQLEETIQALRKTILLFDTPALRYVQELGRTNLSLSLNVATELFTSGNVMARSLFTIAVVVDRAALAPVEGKFPELPQLLIQKASQVQDSLLKLQPAMFASLQPYLADALNLPVPLGPDKNTDNLQSLFALDTVLNGVELATALQTQKGLGKEITRDVLNRSFASWNVVVKQASTTVATGLSAPAPVPIPIKPPVLDSQTGALPAGFENWTFVAVDIPQDGKLDLTLNPPRYTPDADFQNADSYRYRACHPVIKSYCTDDKVVTVNRPLPPWTVTLKTTAGNLVFFKRGVDLVCEAALRGADQNPIYTWWLKRSGSGSFEDITALSTRPGRLTLNNIKTSDNVLCKVYGESVLGLRSVSPKDSNPLVAENSPPENITLTPVPGQDVFPLQETVAGDVNSPSTNNKRDIARITVTDSDPADPLQIPQIAVCGGASPCPFWIDSQSQVSGTTPAGVNWSTWTLFLQSPLNFESKGDYSLTLRAVDSAGNELQKNFQLNVIDRNDKIEDILLGGLAVAETSVPENGSLVVSQLGVQDEDCRLADTCQSTRYTYSLLPGQDSASFEIVGRSLRFKNLPDFETAPSQGYSLTLRVTDDAALQSEPSEMKSLDKQIVVKVTDVNEAPTDLTLSASEINENNSPSAVVGYFNIEDVDGSQNAKPELFDFVLTEMTSGTAGNFEIVGQSLRAKKNFDFELLKNVLPQDANNKKYYFTIMVTAKDKAAQNLSVTRTFKIYLNDVNEKPTSIALSKTLLLEKLDYLDANSQINLTTTDPDLPLVNFTYRITSVNGAAYNPAIHPFEISGDKLRPSRILTYNDAQGQARDREFSITLASSDGELEHTQTFVVQVATITISSASFAENDATASPMSAKLIGNLCVGVGNQAECDGWSYALKTPVDGIQLDGKALNRTRAFDFEQQAVVLVPIVVSKLGMTLEKELQILVQDRNDLPTALNFVPAGNLMQTSPYKLLEELPVGTTVGTLTLVDEDASDALNGRVFWVLAGGSEDFEIVQNGADARLAELKVRRTLPAKSIVSSLSVSVLSNYRNDPSWGSSWGILARTLEFNLLSRAKLEAVTLPSASGYHHKQTGTGPLTIDFKIVDESGTAPCSLSTAANQPGVTFSGVDLQLSDSPVVSLSSSGSGFKNCTLSLTPKPNRTGEATLSLSVRWDTGTLQNGSNTTVETSSSMLTQKIAFWRPPQINCPSRIALPQGKAVDGVPCSVSFSDISGIGGSSSVDVSLPINVQDRCGLTLLNGSLSIASFPSASCDTTVSWSAQNKYGEGFSGAPKLNLVPRKFSTNGLVKAIAKDASNNVYLGGSFTSVDPIPASGLTALEVKKTQVVNGNAVVTFDGERSKSCNLTEGFDGPVRAIADAGDGSFWVGGDFTRYREYPVNYLTRLWCSGERVSWISMDTAVSGPVNAITVGSSGNVYVGGRFTTFKGNAAAGLVRLNSDGVRDSTFVHSLPSDAIINAIALSPDEQSIWVGGIFSGYGNSASIQNLVRLNSSGAVASGFSGRTLDGGVFALSLVPNGVVAGGDFKYYGVQLVDRILSIDNNGTPVVGFHAEIANPGFNGRVETLVNDGSSLFVGGSFTSYRGSSMKYLAKLKLDDGSLVTNGYTAPTLDQAVRVLRLIENNSKLVVGGQFTLVSGQPRSRLALVNANDGTVDSNFNSRLGFDGNVLTLALFAGSSQLLVGGDFSSFEGTASSRLAKFSASGVFDSTFTQGLGGGGLNRDVETLAVSDGGLYVGGQFTRVGSTSVGRIAKLNLSSGELIQSFNSGTGFNSTVRVIAPSPIGDRIYVGGQFSSYAGTDAAGLVRLDHAGAIDTGFDIGTGFTSVSAGTPSVNALVVTGGTADSIYVGGEFDQYAGENVVRLVKLDSTGTRDPEFNVLQGADRQILALALKGGDLFVGGQFLSFAGNSNANRLVRLDAQSGEIKSGGAYAVNGAVRTLVVDQLNTVVAGGSFTQVSSTDTGPLFRIPEANSGVQQIGAVGTVHLNGNSGAGVYGLLPVTDSQQPNNEPLNTLLVGGFFSAHRWLSAPFAVRVNTAAGDERVDP